MTGPSFRFRLERVRDFRERREDLARQELAGAMARRQLVHDELRAAEERVDQARAAQLDSASVPCTASDLMALQAYLERAEHARTASAGNLARHDLELSQRRDALTVAAREREALERLKQRRRAEHEREVLRLEGLSLDEIAINGYRRRAA